MKITGADGMMPKVLALITLISGVALSTAADPKEGPIDRVVSLLTKLQTDLETDEASEQAIYDKYACWCEQTTARKAADIEEAKADIKRLGQEILKQKGTVAIRSDEIAELEQKIKENVEAQAAITKSRGKENAAWQAESEETSQAMTAINGAMGVLMKASKPALLQQDASAMLQASVSKVVEAAPASALAALAPAKLAQLRSFMQANGKAKYAPQSMTIQGILSDMYLTMGRNLQDSTAAEAESNRKFEGYIAEKQTELAEDRKVKTKKEAEKAEAETILADATEAYDEVSKQMKADVEFFDITKKACAEKTVEWTERHELRSDEIDGIKKALEVLTSDEAKKMFAKSIKPGLETSFLQLSSTVVPADQKKQAGLDNLYNKLKGKAMKSGSLRLAALASQVRLAKAGHFDEVIKSIDSLIKVLQEEQVNDDKIQEHCQTKRQEIASAMADIEWKITNNEAKIEKLQGLIDLREKEKEQTIKEIADTKTKIQDMKDERKKENEAFIQAKSDDESSIKLLKEAREFLLEFYKKNKVELGETQGSVKFLQADPLSDPDKAPDATFSDKGKRKNQSKGAVSMITMVIEDLEAEIANGIKSEENAQVLFEEALAAAEQLLADLEARKVTLEEKIAARKEEKVAEEKDKVDNEKDLKDQEDEKAKIKKDCDYMIGDSEAKPPTEGKYSERRKYREAESDALVEAKEFLANYYDTAEEAFVQSPKTKSSFASISFSHMAEH